MSGSRWFRALGVAGLSVWLVSCVTVSEEKSPYEKEFTRQEQVRIISETAKQYLRNEEPQRAKEWVRKGLEVDDRSGDLHYMLAVAFWQTAEVELADEHFQKAIQYDESLTEARYSYANFLLQRGQVEEAREQLERVLEDTLYENRANAFFHYARTLRFQGEHEAAIEAARRALGLDRANAPAMLLLAQLYYEQNAYDDANRYYLQYRLNGQQTPGTLLLGIRIARGVGDEDALASYALALENLYPDSDAYQRYLNETGQSDETE